MIKPMNRNGFAPIVILIVVVGILAVGAGGLAIQKDDENTVLRRQNYALTNQVDTLSNQLQQLAAQKQVITRIESPKQAPSPTPQPPAPPKPSINSFQIGQAFDVGSMQFTVLSAVDLGGQYHSNRTTGKYVEVTFSAKNIGTNTASINPAYYILDSLNRHYDTTDSVIYYSPPDGYKHYSSYQGQPGPFGQDMSLNDLKPGFTQSFGSLFEVAADSQGLTLLMGKDNSPKYISLGL
ncbi:MAG: hypothetical protein RL681_17 [Candidatus Parcubacteria bacterium]|jgi:hypothetical protein